MRIQHQLGADIIFAFDECTTLMNTRVYQERSVVRTQAWAVRCLAEHRGSPPNGSAGRTRRCSGWSRARSTRTCAGRPPGTCSRWSRCDGRDAGSTATASAARWRRRTSATIVGWVCEELPEDKPRHLLGISEPDDMFTAIENGADTFDCVSPSRVARNGSIYSPRRSVQRDQRPVRAETSARWTRTATATPARTTPGPTCTTCSGPRRCCRRRCPPSTTSASSSGWSTGSGPASTTARSPISARTSSAATTPDSLIVDPITLPAR